MVLKEFFVVRLGWMTYHVSSSSFCKLRLPVQVVQSCTLFVVQFESNEAINTVLFELGGICIIQWEAIRYQNQK